MEGFYTKMLLDMHHNIIKEFIDDLEELIITRRGDSIKILDELIDVFDTHFDFEDRLMSRYLSKDEVMLHKKEHSELKSDIYGFREQKLFTIDLLLRLKRWSKEHESKDEYLIKQLISKETSF